LCRRRNRRSHKPATASGAVDEHRRCGPVLCALPLREPIDACDYLRHAEGIGIKHRTAAPPWKPVAVAPDGVDGCRGLDDAFPEDAGALIDKCENASIYDF
jgi:hypothetical protein